MLCFFFFYNKIIFKSIVIIFSFMSPSGMEKKQFKLLIFCFYFTTLCYIELVFLTYN